MGLDPRLEFVPSEFRNATAAQRDKFAEAANALREFSKVVIEIVSPQVPAVKVQIAFFEALGWQGMAAYQDVLKCARERGLLVIGDIKRGDIGTTAEAYARAHLGPLGNHVCGCVPFEADAVTVNPYFGSEGVEPFLRACREHGKGIFVLVRTSNPSAQDVQASEKHDEALFLRVARLVGQWGRALIGLSGYSSVGAVVAGTARPEAEHLRRILPHTWFLVPGYGAQGATAHDVAVCFNSDGLGAVVNSSRGIIHAYQGPNDPNWRQRIDQAVRQAKADLAAAVEQRLAGAKPGWS